MNGRNEQEYIGILSSFSYIVVDIAPRAHRDGKIKEDSGTREFAESPLKRS